MAAKKAPKSLPDGVFIRWDDAGDGEFYLVADESIDAHAEINGAVKVGYYKLYAVKTVVCKPSFK